MFARALAYAEAGVSVFPCVPGEKRPLTSRGFLDATIDLDRIRAWWTATPDANIAAPTGHPAFDALDVDVRPDGNGWAALHKAHTAGLIEGWIRAVRTPSGGLHLHYQGTEQRNGSLRGQHLDFRGLGGYVLLPPSLIRTSQYSRRYDLVANREAPGRALDWAAITHWLAPVPVPRAVGPQAATRVLDPIPGLAAHVARQREGNRDNALFWAACRAAEAGVPDLTPLIDAAIVAGLPEREARRTTRSAQDTVARGFERPTPWMHPSSAPSGNPVPARCPETSIRSVS